MKSQFGDPLRMSMVKRSLKATAKGLDVSDVLELVVPDAVAAATVGLLLKMLTPFLLIVNVSPVVPSDAFVTIWHRLIVPARGASSIGPTSVPAAPLLMANPITSGDEPLAPLPVS